MEDLARGELKILMEEYEGPCVSIFMPTHLAGAEIQQNPIRLKNLLAEAEGLLLKKGLRSLEAQELLEPARELVEDQGFWRRQSEGLAIFLCSGAFLPYRLPFDLEELVVVGDRFHIKPLLPLLSGEGRFYILALSQNEIRLLQGTHFSVSQVDLETVPKSLADALQWDDAQRRVDWHTHTGGYARGRRAAVYHGHGVDSADEHKDHILHYFRRVDQGLHELLRDEQAPLVLAGVDYLFPIYREANNCAHLVDEGIKGNPEELSAEQLREQAGVILQPLFIGVQEEAAARYRQLAGTGSERASADLKEVVLAAYNGRVETLFVSVELHQWGSFDAEANEVELHEEMESGDEDLLDYAAAHTLLNRGSVYAVESEEVPDDASRAAVFRY